VNRPGGRARPLSDARETASFDYCAFRSWKLKPSGSGHRLESEWARERWDSSSLASAISRPFASGGRADLESEPAGAPGVVSKTNERASVTVRVRRSPRMDGKPAGRQVPV
jgi:hypothetical protein